MLFVCLLLSKSVTAWVQELNAQYFVSDEFRVH